MKKKVLIIDDDIDLCLLLERFLTRKGFDVESAHTGKKGVTRFQEGKFDIVICDYRLGDREGKEVLKEIKAISPEAIVLIITGYSDIKTAIDVIKLGAYDYITKPLIPDEVINVINTAVQGTKEQAVFDPPKISVKQKKIKENSGGTQEEFLIGEAPSTRELYNQINIVAPTNYSIILYGESGTGKEVIARAIHHLSRRADKPFIALDCGTLSKELSGSELFGHMKGAFTGALNDKEGLFELANGGTLFLDEVGNLSPDVQASLLRVIQERSFKRVGGNTTIPVDIRIIVASNENLQAAYRKGRFREDLYHRFNEFSINLPPLRNRKGDIPLFAKFFLDKTNHELGRDIKGFDPEVMEMFLNYSWPGNLREFRNVVRRAVLLTTEGLITRSVLPWEITNPVGDTSDSASPALAPAVPESREIDLKDSASRAEYEIIMEVLRKVNFNKTKAAEILKIDRKTLYNKIRNFEETKKHPT